MEFQLRVDRRCFVFKLVLKIRGAPIDELDHVVPDFFDDEFEVESDLHLLVLAVPLDLVVDVHLLVDASLSEVKHVERLVADERVEPHPLRVPHLDVQVLLHQLEIARLVRHFYLRLVVCLGARVQVVQFFCHLRDAFSALGQIHVSRLQLFYLDLGYA